jgi:nucleoside-diphosphate-sugar epimerase
MKHKTISILGGGWLGTPLAEALEQKGYIVKVSTASEENHKRLVEEGKNAFQVNVRSGKVLGNAVQTFLEADILIINITPNRDELNQEQFASLLPLVEASSIQNVLFVSSTSVYPNVNRSVSEEEGIELKNHHLYRSEQFLSNNAHFETTVVRMAGLIGGKRHPGRFFRKTGLIKNGNAPVNLIHRVDCITIMMQIIEQSVWGVTFNACSDTHPLKKDFYPIAAKAIGLDIPKVELETENDFKIIDNQKIKKQLQLQLNYPDLLKLVESNNWI